MEWKHLTKWVGSRILICTLVAIVLVTDPFGSITLEVKASEYPTKPITIIVPWAAGSSTDLVPRFIAPKLSIRLGVPVNVVNKPGSLGIGGTLEVVQSAPDGHTLLSECPSTCSIITAWVKDLPFKVEERTYVARAVVLPTIVWVRADSPWKDLQDVEKAIRENPASFRWGVVGTTQMDIGIYQFKADLVAKGVELSQTKTVQFQAATPAIIALAGGQVDILTGSLGAFHTFFNAGKLKIIATIGKGRHKFFPDVRTAAEQGYPSPDTRFWVGLSGPLGLPKNVVQTLIDHTKEVVNDPKMLPEWNKLGGIPAFLAGEEFKKFVLDETRVIKGVKPF